MSKQKHDLGRIKRARPPSHPEKSKGERKKQRSERITAAYDRVEKLYQQATRKRVEP